jgi:NADPH:quinone reductase-like Zn-dependent oxidoreductase
VRSLGADHVIDYTRADFTTGTDRYDLIVDNVENRPMSLVRRALTPRGTLVLNSGTGASGLRMFARLLWPILLSPFTGHSLRRYLSNPKRADLEWLAERAVDGSVRPLIGSSFALADTAAALRHLETGHSVGKVVVDVQAASATRHLRVA